VRIALRSYKEIYESNFIALEKYSLCSVENHTEKSINFHM